MSDRDSARDVDVVVVGAGFAGLYMLFRLRSLGFSVQGFEAADGVGGTWYWNRYPGARCDIESQQYSYSFLPELEQEWEWSERYASQPEILRYLNHVADRLELRPLIRFGTRVTSAVFDEQHDTWAIETDRGEVVRTRFFILAAGCLSVPRLPEIPGLDSFNGRILQTSRWPHERVTFEGERVGVIGTGSSGIQSIPVLAKEAGQLFVFQRTPCFSVPAHNAPLAPEARDRFKANARQLRHAGRHSFSGTIPLEGTDFISALSVSPEERTRRYQESWTRGGLDFMTTFSDLFMDRAANDTVIEFLHDKIRAHVTNPGTAEKLLPRGYPAFAKRLCVDTGYFDTFNRANVTLVDIRNDPIREVTPSGIRTSEADYALDTIIFATGFDAMTGPVLAIDIRGRDGRTLREKWQAGPRTYLGLAVAGFPNLFTVTGPGSPSVLTNMVVSIEQHVEWIAECLRFLRERSISCIEAREDAESKWVDHVSAVGATTLFPDAPSWYMGANVPGKPRVFMAYFGGAGPYRKTCDEVAQAGYAGFGLSP